MENKDRTRSYSIERAGGVGLETHSGGDMTRAMLVLGPGMESGQAWIWMEREEWGGAGGAGGVNFRGVWYRCSGWAWVWVVRPCLPFGASAVVLVDVELFSF
jgi:hypothetical protein